MTKPVHSTLLLSSPFTPYPHPDSCLLYSPQRSYIFSSSFAFSFCGCLIASNHLVLSVLHEKKKTKTNIQLFAVSVTHVFWAISIYRSLLWAELSRKVTRKAFSSPEVDTTHIALERDSCSPNTCLDRQPCSCNSNTSTSTTALEAKSTTRYTSSPFWLSRE